MHKRVTPTLVVMLISMTVSVPAAELISVKTIWGAEQSGKPHNAFTDMIRFQGKWYVGLREALKHHGGLAGKGRLRVICSEDREKWKSAGSFVLEEGDLRDAKLSITKDDELMLNSAIQVYHPDPVKHKNFAWFSKDGRNWSEPVQIGETDIWLWSVTWHNGVAYGVGYPTTRKAPTRLYKSDDGRKWEVLVKDFQGGNESSVTFGPGDTAHCLLRGSGMLGTSNPPYKEWTWKKSISLGGPDMIRLPDGRFIAGGRSGWGTMDLFQVNPDTGKATQLLRLPAKGDSSYPGLVYHNDELWVSYYSSSDKSSKGQYPVPCEIRLARVQLDSVTQDHEKSDGVVIYDYDPSTSLGDDVFGTVVANLEKDQPGRCSHGGPVCMEYANGDLVAFYANTSGHNLDGWSEYAISKDKGRTWKKYNKLKYSHDLYQKDPKRPVWVEEGLVTQKGTVVLFLTHFENGRRAKIGTMRSYDHGASWTDFEPVDGSFVGYPAAVAVAGETNYVLIDSNAGPHVLYVSTDDGKTWQKKSKLTLDDEKWYGALCIMADGRLLAGAYATNDEQHFHYCISEDGGQTWGEQRKAYVDKKIRDPELACLNGRYYLHGRSGHRGKWRYRFVLYESDDGVNWKDGIIISGNTLHPDGYGHNCIINKYDRDVPNELMVLYSIVYAGNDTNEYVFFIRPGAGEGE